MDERGKWWYFFCPVLGGTTVIVSANLIVKAACEANIRCAFKSKKTVRYAHKVAFRTGMYAIFLTFGIGLLTLIITLSSYECNVNLIIIITFLDWWAENDPARY